jgi:hypothetical protein
MVDVQVAIDGIVLYCDVSVSQLNLGKGYSIRKVYINDITFKKKITDGNGNLTINYLGSQMSDDNGKFLMCVHKEDIYQIQLPQMTTGLRITDNDLMCNDQLEYYKDIEMTYLYRVFSLLHLFKKGNIGLKEVFFEHSFTVMGFINNNKKQTNDSVTKNIVNSSRFSLSPEEVDKCNSFLHDTEREYEMLKSCIDEFVWGLEQTDIPTGFEQYTTALEMVFLATNQQGKKEVLSKRVAVLLENDPESIRALYNKMKNFYRFRSESLHEGDGRSITSFELNDLEEIVRRVLLKYLDFCKSVIQINASVSWDEVKADKINELKDFVTDAVRNEIL